MNDDPVHDLLTAPDDSPLPGGTQRADRVVGQLMEVTDANFGNGGLASVREPRAGRLAVAPYADEPRTDGTTSLSDSLLGIQDIRALFLLGRTAAYELTHRPGFPAPVRISPRCYRWWAKEVTAFAANLRQHDQAGRSAGSRRQSISRPTAARSMPAMHITGKVRMARGRTGGS